MGRSPIYLTYVGVSQAVSTEMSQGFLKIIDDNFLTERVFHPTQRSSVLYLNLTDKEDVITELKISGFLGANDYNLILLLNANRIKDILIRNTLDA